MKANAVALFIFCGFLASWGQAPAPGATAKEKPKPVSPFAEYAGVWSASFNGSVWMQLQLELTGEQMTGSLVHAKKIEFSDNGELKSVSEEQATEAVVDAVVNPDGLMLTFRDSDTAETNRYVMKLTSPAKDAAELKVVGMQLPPGIAKPKPWKLTKTVNSSPNGAGAPSELAKYAGDWVARFEGKVWLLLELEIHGEQLTGSLIHSTDIELNDDGGLKSVSDEKVKESVSEATLTNAQLLLTIQTANGKEPDRYLMSLSPSGKAGALGMLATDLPTGVPMPQPWELLKIEAPKTGQAAALHETNAFLAKFQ